MDNIHYVSVEDVLHLRDELARNDDEFQILRFSELLSALAAPQQILFGEELFPTLCAKAGMLLVGLIRNHPFWDGNKRIALAATQLFLERNGYALNDSTTEAQNFTTTLARGSAEPATAAAWIEQWSHPINQD